MRLITADPALLRDNPANPRRTGASPDQEAQLLANVRAVGILQPPVARERDGGALELVAGHRRRDAAIAAGFGAIHVLLREPGDDAAEGAAAAGGDGVRALSENMVRAGMGPVDQWRAIEALSGSGEDWSDDGIAGALNLPVRRIRALRQLARVHPAMLDHMARGDMPTDDQLRTIALAGREEQAQVWKKNKPKKAERAPWHTVAAALAKRRIGFAAARFGAAEAEAFGLAWQDDLFVPAGQEGRYTTQVDSFFAAQAAWLEANLPENGTLLEPDEYGSVRLPPRATRSYRSKPGPDDLVGCYVDPRTGEVERVVYTLPEPASPKRPSGTGGTGGTAPGGAPKTRADLSQKGEALVGDMRTDALGAALAEAEIGDHALIGLLVLAFAAENVSVHTDARGGDGRRGNRAALARGLAEGGVLTGDPALLRDAARRVLRHVLSCRPGHGQSGRAARLAGVVVGADAWLPGMATEEFLSCLSKPAVERTASAHGVAPRQTGKATRAALVQRFRAERFVHPAARFALTAAEACDEVERREADRLDAPSPIAGIDRPEDEDLGDAGEEEPGAGGDAAAGTAFPPSPGAGTQPDV